MAWRECVNSTRSENPGLPSKEVLKKASENFRKPPDFTPDVPKMRYVRKQPPRAEEPAV